MRIDILTLFPDQVLPMLQVSIIGRGIERGHLKIFSHQIRDFTTNKQGQVDDYPYGGGLGMVMNADPLARCLDHVRTLDGERGKVIFMSPAGKPFNQQLARELSLEKRLILVCGRYEGVDERFISSRCDMEISVGDYVLTGGELAAMCVADAVGRLIPGVLADEESFERESHWSGLLEHAQYTRPAVWEDMPVPEELLSGSHKKIEKWRENSAIERTKTRRPDLFQSFSKE